MNKTKDMDLGKEPIGKLFFMLAVPAIASQVVNALYNIVDRMYIGHMFSYYHDRFGFCRACQYGRRSQSIHHDGKRKA